MNLYKFYWDDNDILLPVEEPVSEIPPTLPSHQGWERSFKEMSLTQKERLIKETEEMLNKHLYQEE